MLWSVDGCLPIASAMELVIRMMIIVVRMAMFNVPIVFRVWHLRTV